jgi:hypothetical protein
MARTGSGLSGDAGPELFEWIAVTLILTVAFIVLLQVIGPHVQRALDWMRDALGGLVASLPSALRSL